jgi:Cu/Ag efflux protein CusF
MERTLAVLALATLFMACQKQATEPAATENTYTMNGKLVSREASRNEVTIDNEDVPGVMSPMTMAYELRGSKVASIPPDGSKITSTLHERDGKYWITDIKPAR